MLITEENFDQYFFDVRKNKPQKGQVMACYSAMAELIEGNEKKQIIDLLTGTEKANAASQVMRKLLHASEHDSVRVLREMTEDLLSGMTKEQVEKKPYKYKLEMFFYCEPQYVPVDDPHWSSINLLNLNDFLKVSEQPSTEIGTKFEVIE